MNTEDAQVRENKKNSVTGNQIRERIKQVSAELEIWQVRFLPSLKAFQSELDLNPERKGLPFVVETKILDLESRVVLLQNLLAEYNTKVRASVSVQGGLLTEPLGVTVKTLGGLQRMRKRLNMALTQATQGRRGGWANIYRHNLEESFTLNERATADVEREVMVVSDSFLEDSVLRYDRLISNYKLAIAAANLAEYKTGSLGYLFEEGE